MTVLSDVVLPKVSVLGSTMAYRKVEIPRHRSRFFCTGTQPRRTFGGISFRWLRRWRIASRRISSGSVNRENPISSIDSPIMCGTSMRTSIKLESLQR